MGGAGRGVINGRCLENNIYIYIFFLEYGAASAGWVQ